METPTVLIDGTEYLPADRVPTSHDYVCAITTHNRPSVFAETFKHFKNILPSDVPLIVVADNTQTRDSVKKLCPNVVLSKPGVYNAKNECLRQCMDTGKTHIFLCDDDIYPVDPQWADYYINRPEKHYAHSFDLYETYRDANLVATIRSGGTMLYFTRDIIQNVGGFKNDFGTWGHEHVNLSDRIHNLGYTTFRYQDVPEAVDGKLFHELDRKEYTPKNFHSSKTPQQAQVDKAKYPLWESLQYTDTDYVEYRSDPLKYVFTVYLDGLPDPQRQGQIMQAAPDLLKPLVESVRTHGYTPIVITNMGNDVNRAETLHIDPPSKTLLPFDHMRWNLLLNALDVLSSKLHGLQHVEAWCVDATDVTMLHTPRPETDSLYIGCEQDSISCKWMQQQLGKVKNLHNTQYADMPPRWTLLNPGVVGGDALRLRTFAQRMHDYAEQIADRIPLQGITDMVTCQLAARDCHAQYGAFVTAGFKNACGTESAWWAHKSN